VRRAPTALSLLVLLAPGCTLDTRDLDAFRSTATGPDKLSALVHDRSRPAPLRAESALRLIDLERANADGSSLLFAALTALDSESRRALVPTLERGLRERMQTREGAVPSERAVRAKDIGVRLLALLEPSDRERMGGELVRWTAIDLARRGDAGEFSLEQLAERIGGASAIVGAQSLRQTLSASELTRLTDSVAKHGGPAARALAAARWIEIEGAHRALPERRAELAAHALPSLGRFVEVEPARKRLLAIAGDRTIAPGERKLALELLRGNVRADDLSVLADIVLDTQAELALRELSLARVGETRSTDALPTLLSLAADRANRSLRQAAASLVIELGGERGLATLMRTLPSHWSASYARSEIELYVARVLELPVTGSLTAQLGGKLYSVLWWNRVIAIRYFAERAHPLDASWRLRLHVDDKQEIVGPEWPAHWTIGQEARAALKAVSER
jgi:hypothetical protein